MILPFLRAAMLSPDRRGSFRRAAVGHAVFLAGLTLALENLPTAQTVTLIGYALLGAGIVEGAALCGWRLTQLPKSQALEFLLTSPLQPPRLFCAEALVGLARMLLVTLSGLPWLLLMCWTGKVESLDLPVLLGLPFLCGAVTGLGIAVWTYEPKWVRRVGEILSLFGVLVYLVVGVLAGERLREWLQSLPEGPGQFLYDLFNGFRQYNPFGLMEYWLRPDRDNATALTQMSIALVGGVALVALLLARGAARLRGHFGDTHYLPIDSRRADQSAAIGDWPLSWWAVRRVMVYSGRVNLYLAGGFAVVYSAYLVAGEHWPAWMGQLVFQIFERLGGAPMLITGMAILASVPAAFQYGLWDPSAQDRCRRLELLLLTDLTPRDYWDAAFRAAWRRGRGYLVIAGMLWLAMWLAGSIGVVQILASLAASIVLWVFAFAVGFHCFSTGRQANGQGALLTLGAPMLTVFALKSNLPWLATLMPPGAVYLPLVGPPDLNWAVGPAVIAIASLVLMRSALQGCDGNLRRWYDRNHGAKLLN